MSKPVKKVELEEGLKTTILKNAKGNNIDITLRNGHKLQIECFERAGRKGICIFGLTGSLGVYPHSSNVVSIFVI